MSNKHVNIKLRRGTAAEWTASNELLSLGEPGFEKDTRKLKIGDGITLWNDLPYITPDFINIVSNGAIADLTISQQNQIVEGAIVLTTDGVRWVYSGTGSKINETSYVQLADISPAWIQITSKPASLVGLADIASSAIGDFILATGNNTYQVTNFAEGVDDRVGQLVVSGTGINISYNDNLNTLIVSTTGVSFAGHSHTSSDITNFNSSVSGLLPVTNILGGSNINVSTSGTNYTIAVSGSLGLTTEEVDDRVSNLLVAGSGINLSYNDNLNSLTVSASGISFVGTKGIDVNDLLSGQKEITTNFIAGNGIAFNYNNDESLTISTISNNGTIAITNNSTTNITIPNGYVVGSLSLYQNGVKLLEGIDYTATNGTTATLTTPPTTGSYIEYTTPTISNNIQSLIDTVYDTIIYDLGTIAGATSIDYDKSKMIQRLTINNSSVSLNKGSGWPTLSNISRDVILQINCTTPATITWNIVGANWYNTPTALLTGEEHTVLLRSVGNIIQGHYIGKKQSQSTITI